MRGDPPPRRDTGKAAPTIPARRTAGGGLGTDFDCDGGLIAHALRAEGCDASEDGTGRGTPLVVAPALTAQEGKGPDSDATTTLVVSDPTSANEGRTYSREGRNNFRLHNVIPFDAPEPAFIHVNKGRPAGRQSAHEEMVTVKPLVETIATDGHSRSAVITFDETQITSPLNRSVPKPGDPSHPIPAHGRPPSLATVAFVRRLTPRECERLQGFPDDWTLVPYRGKQAADGPRYRAIGNSMATPVMRWIGERIALCERALSAREVAA